MKAGGTYNQNKRGHEGILTLKRGCAFAAFFFCFAILRSDFLYMNMNSAEKYFISFFILLYCLLFPGDGSAARVACVNIGTTMELKNIAIEDRTCGIMMGLFTHRSLTRFSSDGEIIGDLAATWKVSDGTVWTFTIENGVRWHDGKPVTAYDAAFTYKYLVDKFPVYKNHFNLLEDAEAPDAQTLRIRLRQPNYRFAVNVCGIEILPKHIFEKVDEPREFSEKWQLRAAVPLSLTRLMKKTGCSPLPRILYMCRKG